MTPQENAAYGRLLDVACRRVAGQTWDRIAADMGWSSKQAASRWAYRWLDRFSTVEPELSTLDRKLSTPD